MQHRFEGQVAMVTGAASGIGRGVAERLVAEGAQVVVADLQRDAGEAVAAALGSAARFVAVDVTDEAQVAAAVDLATAEFGRLDVMVANAGIVGVVGPIADTPTEAWHRTVAVLLDGVFYCMKHAARVMVPAGRGAIVSTSSTAGILGGLGPHCYTACKHAVIGLTKSVASELAGHGIRVNAVAPGNTATTMTATVTVGDPHAIESTEQAIAARSPLGISGTPADIAAAVAYLASDEARYVTGHTLVVDAGETALGGPGRFHSVASQLFGEAGRRERFS